MSKLPQYMVLDGGLGCELFVRGFKVHVSISEEIIRICVMQYGASSNLM